MYEAALTAHRAAVPVRLAAQADPPCEGLPDPRLNPRPTVHGVQTALVVGLGAPVHTDRDHRIKIQFHWQRGAHSSHRLSAPAGDNAPASDASGTWVRVAEQVAGANWGSHFIPRLGQEVLIGFIGGDIDRPVVLGAVYNGQGQPDAQSNRIAAGSAGASGNAPAWFPGAKAEGRLQAHQHGAVHAGYKSQELASSAGGSGGHNQLVLDDSAGQGRIELSSSSAATRLQLGHLLHQTDNRRLNPRGHGLDLATQAWGALRAGSGILLSAHGKPASTAGAMQMDLREPRTQLEQSTELAHNHVLLTAAGAAIRIEGGNITLSGPGKVEFRAGVKELGAGRAPSPGVLTLPNGDLELPNPLPHVRSLQWQVHGLLGGAVVSELPFELVHDKILVASGKTNAAGKSLRHQREQDYSEYQLWLGESGWSVAVEEAEGDHPSPLDDSYDLSSAEDEDSQ